MLALLSQLQYLTLPQTAVRCLETVGAGDPGETADLLCEVVASDPPLAARMLGVANSAFFALPRQVYDVRTAIINVLGLDLARNLALSMAVNDCFDVRRCRELDLRRYWTMALVSAQLAGNAGNARPGAGVPAGAVELCALLRDLGLLALAHVAPGETAQALRSTSRAVALGPALRQALGIDHRQALELLVGRWKLPLLVAETCGPDAPATELAAHVRPLVESAHDRAAAWWADYSAVADATLDGAEVPHSGLTALEYGAAERLFTLVESCIPLN